MNDICKFIKKYSCRIIIFLCIIIILMSVFNKGQEHFQISENDTTPVVVMFHANWCGHCKKLMPEWMKFEKAYHGKKGINVVKIESDEDKSLVKLHGVNGYPTIKYCPRGVYNTDGTVDFNGSRNLPGLADFYNKYAKNEEHFTSVHEDDEDDEDDEDGEYGEDNEDGEYGEDAPGVDELFTL